MELKCLRFEFALALVESQTVNDEYFAQQPRMLRKKCVFSFPKTISIV